MERKPAVSGSFYPGDKKNLKIELEKFLPEKKENILACISPHAGYDFSGKLAGKTLGKFNKKKDFIILGVNHSGIGNKICISLKDFETPLGVVKNNKALSENLLKKLKSKKLDAELNELPHKNEHSIEVQLPFLQFSQKNFEFVPILLNNLGYGDCKKTAEILSKIVDENIGLIVSSDFTHFGSQFGFKPFDNGRRIVEVDNNVIKNILEKKSENVYNLASKSTICGLHGLTIITEIANINKWKVKEVEYVTSGDVTGNYEQVVGYAGIMFY